MKIRYKIPSTQMSHDLEVYGVYWIDRRRHYYAMAPGHAGLNGFSEYECELIDASIKDFIITKSYRGEDMLIHRIIFEESILDRLIDTDLEALELFRRRLLEINIL